MTAGLYTRWDIDSETSIYVLRQNKTNSFGYMVMSYFQRPRPDCKNESFRATGRQNNIDCFGVVGFCCQCNTLFEAMGCFYHFCASKEMRVSLTEEDIKRGTKKRKLDALRRDYIQEKGFTDNEIWEREWCRLYKATKNIKQHIREKFPYRRSLTEHQLIEEKREETFLGYVQWDIEVLENLGNGCAQFPPTFENTLVSKNDMGHLMKKYAEEENILFQVRQMLISSFSLQKETPITPLFLFYL